MYIYIHNIYRNKYISPAECLKLACWSNDSSRAVHDPRLASGFRMHEHPPVPTVGALIIRIGFLSRGL